MRSRRADDITGTLRTGRLPICTFADVVTKNYQDEEEKMAELCL